MAEDKSDVGTGDAPLLRELDGMARNALKTQVCQGTTTALVGCGWRHKVVHVVHTSYNMNLFARVPAAVL